MEYGKTVIVAENSHVSDVLNRIGVVGMRLDETKSRILEMRNELNAKMGRFGVRPYLRYRYRGKRRVDPETGRVTKQGRSTCLRADAESVTVYVNWR